MRQNPLDGGVVEREGQVHCCRAIILWPGLAAEPLPNSTPPPTSPQDLREIVITLFELGREVTSVLDLQELLQKIPQLVSRLTHFHAFAAYLLDEKAGELKVAYSVGYPEPIARTLRLKVGEGLVLKSATVPAPMTALHAYSTV